MQATSSQYYRVGQTVTSLALLVPTIRGITCLLNSLAEHFFLRRDKIQTSIVHTCLVIEIALYCCMDQTNVKRLCAATSSPNFLRVP